MTITAIELAFKLKDFDNLDPDFIAALKFCSAKNVHLLVDVDPQFGVHKYIKNVKGASSKLLRDKYKELRSRVPTLWTIIVILFQPLVV